MGILLLYMGASPSFVHAQDGPLNDLWSTVAEQNLGIKPLEIGYMVPRAEMTLTPPVLTLRDDGLIGLRIDHHDRGGLRTAVVTTGAWYVAGMAILLSMNQAVTGWDEPPHIRNVARAFTSPPHWDADAWYFNYVGHPVWGSETYLAARREGYPRAESFLFSTLASISWEYLVESWAQQPSTQDLLLTSTLGSVLGELRYRGLMALADSDGPWARLALIGLDPLRSLMNLLGLQVNHGAALRPK